MEQKTFKEEYLEVLWYMKEDGNTSLSYFEEELGENFKAEVLKEIVAEGIVQVADRRISLTEKGNSYTRQLIRSHRLAERLVHDVLGVGFEKGACEFEHILNPDLVDSICTLLGHPRECPHGMPIPEGECCRQRAQMVESSVTKGLQPIFTFGPGPNAGDFCAPTDAATSTVDSVMDPRTTTADNPTKTILSFGYNPT
jgi:DtxR family Mn-dependent transcriptional regulator